MKKTLLVYLLAILASTTMWGKEYVLDFSNVTYSTKTGAYTKTCTATASDGLIYSLANFNNGSSSDNWTEVRCGRKNNASVATITSPAFSEAITKVTVKITTATTDKATVTLETSTDNQNWTTAGTFTNAVGEQSVSIESPAANLYYQVKFDCQSTSSNGFERVAKVTYSYGAVELGAVSGTFGTTTIADAETYTVEEGTEFTFKADNAESISVQYGDLEAVTTTGSTAKWTAVTGQAEDAVMTVTAKMGETTKALEFFLNVTALDPNRPGTVNNPYTVAQALEACTAKGETSVYVKGIVTSVNTWNSSFSNINYYIADTENGTETLYIFRGMWIDGANITAENQPEVGATVVLKGDFDIYSNTKELINSSIVTYTPSAKETVTITAEPETAKIDLATSDLTIANPFTISVEGLEMTYSSDNENVATVDATGLITGVSMGTAVITATFVGNNAYLPAEATFTVDVVDSSIAYTDISTTTLTGDGTGYAVDRSYTDTYGVDFFGRYYSSNGMQFNQGNDNLNGIIVKSNPHKYRIKAIEFTFYSKSTAGRTLTLYADNKPYSELESTEGTLISDAIEKGTDNKATVSFEGKDFMYFSLFAPKSVQIENIRIYWVSEKSAKPSAPTFTYDAATKTMAIDVDHGYNIQYYTFFYNPESTVDTPADDSTIVWTDVNGDHCTVSAGETTGTTVFGITARAIDPENADNFAEGTIGVTSDGQTTGIEAVDADSADAAVEYFNLQGVRVATPAEGLYIRRQGNKVEKVLVK